MEQKDQLVEQIEKARKLLDRSIERNDDYEDVYRISIKLDNLVEAYIAAGY